MTIAITGSLLIGQNDISTGKTFRAIDPARAEPMEPPFSEAGLAEIEAATRLAAAAFPPFRETAPSARAYFLETIATHSEALGELLIERAARETGLSHVRLTGERARTANQLRLFAEVLREGSWIEARIDPALPDRKPAPRPDLRSRYLAAGPVAVFGASNFPLAFSVAGGDTASALAAGCPVIVKGHRAHPGTAELVGRAIRGAVKECKLPEGVFSLLSGASHGVGEAIVADPRIMAVGFTGSRTGGLALMGIAAARPVPIPVYAEMSSINPVFLLPAALEARAEAMVSAFVNSLTLGAGQFCTNPGLVIGIEGPALGRFIASAKAAIEAAPAATMLTAGIYKAYCAGVAALERDAHVSLVARGLPGAGENSCQAALFATEARSFLADPALCNEVFGASSLIVRCTDFGEMKDVALGLEGQLTASLHLDEDDHGLARQLLPILEERAGRILANGWPTGVEVCHAMVHGRAAAWTSVCAPNACINPVCL